MKDGARRRALKKGLEYNLKSYKDLPEVPVFCPILGIPLVSNRGSKNGGSDNSPSLDRINNDRGYIIGNLQIISRKANQMKSNGSFEDIKKLYLFMKQQQIKQKWKKPFVLNINGFNLMINKIGVLMNNIREIVKDRGYRLSYIAKRIGVFNSHLSMWISEQRYPSQDKLIKLSRVLKCSIKDLYPNVVRRTYWNIKGKDNG